MFLSSAGLKKSRGSFIFMVCSLSLSIHFPASNRLYLHVFTCCWIDLNSFLACASLIDCCIQFHPTLVRLSWLSHSVGALIQESNVFKKLLLKKASTATPLIRLLPSVMLCALRYDAMRRQKILFLFFSISLVNPSLNILSEGVFQKNKTMQTMRSKQQQQYQLDYISYISRIDSNRAEIIK